VIILKLYKEGLEMRDLEELGLNVPILYNKFNIQSGKANVN
jgi:hypothetical protein